MNSAARTYDVLSVLIELTAELREASEPQLPTRARDSDQPATDESAGPMPRLDSLNPKFGIL